MESLSPGEACLRLADELEQHWSTGEDLNKSHKELIANLRSLTTEISIKAFMPSLAAHVEDIFRIGQPEEFKTAILCTLAEATREVPFWRPLFGVEAKLDYASNLAQLTRRSPPDSILEVARRIIVGYLKTSSSEQMRYALRLIANTCADNNANRSIVINRDGVEELLEFLMKGRECDLVIPVLYNVCIDYDEPPTGPQGKPWTPLQRMQSTGAEASAESILSAADFKMGSYYFLYEDKTSFEMLLNGWKHAENCAGMVADLVEMASRVALIGTDMFIQENDGRDPEDRAVIDTTADIVRLLLSEGAKLADVDIECRVSICQAVINVLSQEETHSMVINHEGALRQLIYLPYRWPGREADDDEEHPLKPYQKEILKLVYKLSASELYTQAVNVESPLIRDCIGRLEMWTSSGSQYSAEVPLASSWVLLANCVTTTERAQEMLRSTAVGSFLPGLLLGNADPEVLLPAVDLAARLALCPEGQTTFCSSEVNMFAAVTKLLHDRHSEADTASLGIQRNIVSLARLLVKGRNQDILKLNESTSWKDVDTSNVTTTTLVEEMFDLSDRTKDLQTKLEMGRLFIEILRTIFSSNTPAVSQDRLPISASAPDQTTSGSAETHLLHAFGSQSSSTSTPVFRATVTDVICYNITQSQPQTPSPSPSPSSAQHNLQTETEAWFGLALLSTMLSARPSIRTALAHNSLHLLTQLRNIVSVKHLHLLLRRRRRSTTYEDTTGTGPTAAILQKTHATRTSKSSS